MALSSTAQRLRVKELDDCGVDEGFLVTEGAEHRTLGYSGCFGDLLRADVSTVLREERHDGLEDHRAPVIDGERLGAGARAFRRSGNLHE